jgi:LPLT family lysophospholipid transporter-like MFS transporter
MGIAILLFGLVDGEPGARLALFLIGLGGGVFVVPINAALQHIGHDTVGSGRAVAVQNFFQNVAMLITVGIYTAASAIGISPVASVFALGFAVLAATLLVAGKVEQ